MRDHSTEFTVGTDAHVAVVDITDRVSNAVPSGWSGVATVFVRHTTAGLVLNEAEPRLLSDIRSFVESLEHRGGHAHDDLDGNAAAHLRSMLLGRSVQVPFVDGTPDLGTWQSVLLVECDGPRTRTVRVYTD